MCLILIDSHAGQSEECPRPRLVTYNTFLVTRNMRIKTQGLTFY